MVLSRFYTVLRSLRLYPLENSTVQQAIDDLQGRLPNSSWKRDPWSSGSWVISSSTTKPARLDLSNYSTFGSFARTLTDHGLGALEVLPGIDRAEWPVPFPFASGAGCGRPLWGIHGPPGECTDPPHPGPSGQ